MKSTQPKTFTDLCAFRTSEEIKLHLSNQSDKSRYIRNLILSDMLNPCPKDKEALLKSNLQ
jgi:hypothetical protein